MNFPFTQAEIERRIADKVPHGMRRDIARTARIGESIVYGWFNPDDERKSPFYLTLSMLAAGLAEHPVETEELFQEFCKMYEQCKPMPFAPKGPNVEQELANLSQEFTDVIRAKCEGKSETEQRHEIAELRSQINRYEDALFGGESVN